VCIDVAIFRALTVLAGDTQQSYPEDQIDVSTSLLHRPTMIKFIGYTGVRDHGSLGRTSSERSVVRL
jgi:hypothetical protein